LTKSTLILRDGALLAAASERTDVAVSFSIGTLDRSVWKLTEPGTPPPDRRIEALRRLRDLGISCGVLVAPVLPGLSDSEEQLTEVVEACAGAGAVSITGVALHLRGAVRGHYFDWLAAARPDLVRLHRGRFRRGAYQEDPERERVEGIVGAAARRCGVTGRDRYRGRSPEASPIAGTPRERVRERHRDRPEDGGRAEGEQLQLL
jgi:DNA repair photolyase